MSDGRWLLRRTWRRQVPMTLVLAFLVAGLALAALDHWVTGLDVMAAGLGVGAVIRAVVPRRAAGLLAVRHRFTDVVLMGGAAVAMVILTTSLR